LVVHGWIHSTFRCISLLSEAPYQSRWVAGIAHKTNLFVYVAWRESTKAFCVCVNIPMHTM